MVIDIFCNQRSCMTTVYTQTIIFFKIINIKLWIQQFHGVFDSVIHNNGIAGVKIHTVMGQGQYAQCWMKQ